MCMNFSGTRDYASSLSEGNFKVGKTVSPYYLFSLTNILFSLNSICQLPSWAVISFSKPNPQVPLCASSCLPAKKSGTGTKWNVHFIFKGLFVSSQERLHLAAKMIKKAVRNSVWYRHYSFFLLDCPVVISRSLLISIQNAFFFLSFFFFLWHLFFLFSSLTSTHLPGLLTSYGHHCLWDASNWY